MTTPAPFYVHEDDPPAKREILQAALRLFSERGLAATSIRDIADRSGYTNPALYKHFRGKEELALYLFEVCHRRVWTLAAEALASATSFEGKLDTYLGAWLSVIDEHPEVFAFLSDSARALWPRSGLTVRRHTMIGLARALMREAPRARRGAAGFDPELAAASLQGTLAELARMIQVGAAEGPAMRWKERLLALFTRMGS